MDRAMSVTWMLMWSMRVERNGVVCAAAGIAPPAAANAVQPLNELAPR